MSQYGLWSGTVDGYYGGVDPDPPAQVTGVVLQSRNGLFRISWNAVEGAINYQVELKQDGAAFTGDNLIVIDDTTVDWADGVQGVALHVGSLYHCRVRAEN